MRRTVPTLAVLLLAAVPAAAAPAAADPTDPTGATGATDATGAEATTTATRRPITVGARVGGYGFRNPGTVDGHGHVAWDDCRMNGVGVFARRPLGRLFTEAGADLYFSESFPVATAASEDGMDRMSGLLTVAIGADLVRTRHVTGYAQLGTGLELTRVAMTMADGAVHRDQRALPLGFIGVGGELRLGARTGLGFNLRTHVMGHFGPDDAGHGHATAAVTAEPADGTIPVSPEIAAQGQFYLAYRL